MLKFQFQYPLFQSSHIILSVHFGALIGNVGISITIKNDEVFLFEPCFYHCSCIFPVACIEQGNKVRIDAADVSELASQEPGNQFAKVGSVCARKVNISALHLPGCKPLLQQ